MCTNIVTVIKVESRDMLCYMNTRDGYGSYWGSL